MKNGENKYCCTDLAELMAPEMFRALADGTRVEILSRLVVCCCEQSVSDVAAFCSVDLSVVSRHLKLLKEAGMLESVKRGKRVYYRARIPELVVFLRELASGLEACCAVPVPATVPERMQP